MQCHGTPGTFELHCAQSRMYSDETTWHPQWKILLENPWKWHFQDSKNYLVLKLSYLNLNLTLTQGYLNPALNDPAQIIKVVFVTFTQAVIFQ